MECIRQAGEGSAIWQLFIPAHQQQLRLLKTWGDCPRVPTLGTVSLCLLPFHDMFTLFFWLSVSRSQALAFQGFPQGFDNHLFV